MNRESSTEDLRYPTAEAVCREINGGEVPQVVAKGGEVRLVGRWAVNPPAEQERVLWSPRKPRICIHRREKSEELLLYTPRDITRF